MRILLLSLLLLPAHVSAEGVLPSPGLGDVAISLGGIVLVILLLAWGIRRFSPGGRLAGSDGIRIVAALPVGARDRIVLIEVGGEQLLVGMSPGRMQTLHVLTRPLEAGSGEKTSGSFAGRLREAMGSRGQ